MRIMFGLCVLIAAAVAVVWLGGEGWLAGRLTERLATRTDLHAASVAPLGARDRRGLHMTDLVYRQGGLAVALPAVDLWIAPLRPTELRADLPETATVRQAGRTHRIGLSDGTAGLRLSPLHGGALRRLGVQAAMLTLDGAPLAEALSLDAVMARLGYDAPPAARAAYVVDLSLAGLRVDALPVAGGRDLPEALSLSGPVRLWLDEILGVTAWTGAAPPPNLVGLRSDGIEIRLGAARARLAGRLSRDTDGRVEGRLAFYTRDGEALLAQARTAGLLPDDAALLATALLAGLGRMPFPGEGIDLPEAADGELRLPVTLRDGRVLLGDIDMGAAPRFPGAS